MLVAEILSQLTIPESDDVEMEHDNIDELKAALDTDGDMPVPKKPKNLKRLDFGKEMWDGDADGRAEARWLRSCVGVRDDKARLSGDGVDDSAWMLGWAIPSQIPSDVAEAAHLNPKVGLPRLKPDGPTVKPKAKKKSAAQPKSSRKIIMLDPEDPMEGYSSPSDSSRSPSPSPSFLEEVAADPSLGVRTPGDKKPKRPIYVGDVISLLKDREKFEAVEMGLKWGEGVVRAKRGFGGELSQ